MNKRWRGSCEQIANAASGAKAKYGDFASMHEAYGVLAEEVQELFDEVRRKQTDPLRRGNIRAEAIDVACVALRIVELLGRDEVECHGEGGT